VQYLLNALFNLVERFEDATLELSAQFLEKPLDRIEFRISGR
jgi:hypothetical protein